MSKICLSFFSALSIFLLYGCASKYVAYPLYPRPYDTYALMWADLQVKEVDHLLQLVEERLHARTLEAYINVQDRINRKLASLITSIDIDAGITKYGEPGFSNVERRAVRVLLEFSQIFTADHLSLARQVVKDTKYNISNYQ